VVFAVDNLLYLSHRIPYPPNKGDKIRSYHLLRGLAERWNVYLGAFIDDDEDWQYVSVLEELCVETKFVKLTPSLAKVRALQGLLKGTSLTMPYYKNAELENWVSAIADRHSIDCVVAFSSSMAQYAAPFLDGSTRIVVDFCDVDSDKWAQYSQRFGGLQRWVYAREARQLQHEETAIAAKSDASVLISDDEAEIFRDRTDTPGARVHTVRNGVDVDFFDPDLELSSPFVCNENAIVFVGAMDYWPNVDAVMWFVNEIFPAIRAKNRDAVFYVVGSNPGPEIRRLDAEDGITVTGRVEDVRPFLKYAACVVAPLRVARGVQNKVLEAMAMARPVVVTAEAIEGISFNDDCRISVVKSVSNWVDQVLAVLANSESDAGGLGGRQHVTEKYSWAASGRELAKVVMGDSLA